MEFTRLGSTGLKVSRLALGCMSFGEPARGNHQWTLDVEPSRAIIRQALDAGINFFDTANAYSEGGSEEILGKALAEFTSREDVVIATKVYMRMRPGPHGAGLSRKSIMSELDSSLRRLGTDYVDLYQIHRWDPETPIEETLEALHDVVKAGKVRYIGASSMWAWQFAQALYKADLNGWTRFASMQNHYNLLNREEEREMIPLCIDEGIGVLPWSPLARGRLTRDWGTQTRRTETDGPGKSLYLDSDEKIVRTVGEVAARRGISRAQVAMAWLLGVGGITAPIIGATKSEHLADAVAALDVELDEADVAQLTAAYEPHRAAGF